MAKKKNNTKRLFTATFESEVTCLHNKEKDKFLAKASLENIQDFLPKDIDFEKNDDLIAIAGNGTVVNRANKNGHLIDAETAVQIADQFRYKFLNLDHDRGNIVGVVTNAGFTSYDKNTVMASSDAGGQVDPFYLTIGGVVYKSVNKDFAEQLEESSDPESKLHRKISLSWEIAFSSYYLLVGSKNISEGEVIKDPAKIEEYSQYLDFNGGKNRLEDGTPIYTVVAGDDVLPLGFGFTLTPAAEVEGVLLDSEVSQIDEEEEVEASSKEEKTSLSEEKNVKPHKPSYINMDIKSLEEFYKNWNDIRAAEKAPDLDTIFRKLQEASEKYSADIKAKEEELSNTKQEVEDLKSKLDEMAKQVEEQTASLKALEDEKKAQEEVQKYQERMTVLDDEYQLDDATSAIVASKIKGLSDDEFDAWKKEFDVLAKEKSKAYLAEQKKEKEALAAKTKEVKAEEKKEEETAEEVIANAKEKENQQVPNSTESTQSLGQAWAAALKEGFEIK